MGIHFCLVPLSEHSIHYTVFRKKNYLDQKCAKLSQSTSDKLVSKSVMLAGNCTALNMVFSQTVKCHLTNLSVAVMTLSTPFSLKLVLANTFQELYSSISNQL